MTATVIENKLEEAFGVFRVIAPGTFSSKVQFEKDYCKTRMLRRPRIRIVTGYKRLDQFRKQIEPVFFGRLQDDPEVLQKLPEVVPKDLRVEMSLAQSRKALEAMDKIIEMPDGAVRQLEILPSLTIAQQIVNDPRLLGFKIRGEKVDALIEMLSGSLQGERVVVYSKFETMISVLEKELKKVKLDCVRITGKESDDAREESKRRFLSDGRDRCNILLVTRAGQKAVNLQKGAHLFFFDMPWSYGWYRQMVGRLKRTGSIHQFIGVYRMLSCFHPTVRAEIGTEETIDHYALQVVMKKFKLWQALTDDTKEIKGTGSDIREIWAAIRDSRN